MSAAKFGAALRSPGVECYALVRGGVVCAAAAFPVSGDCVLVAPSPELAFEFRDLFRGLSRRECLRVAAGFLERVSPSALELEFLRAPEGSALH